MELAVHQAQKAADRPQRLLEVVADDVGELLQVVVGAGQFLGGLAELCLGPFPLGDVADDGGEDRFAGNHGAGNGRLDGELLAVGAARQAPQRPHATGRDTRFAEVVDVLPMMFAKPSGMNRSRGCPRASATGHWNIWAAAALKRTTRWSPSTLIMASIADSTMPSSRSRLSCSVPSTSSRAATLASSAGPPAPAGKDARIPRAVPGRTMRKPLLARIQAARPAPQ